MKWLWQWRRKQAAPQAVVPDSCLACDSLMERVDALEEANRGILEALQSFLALPTPALPKAGGKVIISGGVTCPTCHRVHHPDKSCPHCARVGR